MIDFLKGIGETIGMILFIFIGIPIILFFGVYVGSFILILLMRLLPLPS